MFSKFGWVSVVFCLVLLVWRLNYLPLFLGQRPLLDFDTYYALASDVRVGVDPYTVSYMQTMGPPLVIVPYLFFSWLSLPVARMVFTLLNGAGLMVSAVVMAKKLRPNQWLLTAATLLVVLLFSFPVRFSLEQGQPVGWLLVAVSLALFTRKHRWVVASLASLIILKTFFVVTLFSVMRKMPAVFVGAVGGVILCAALVVFWIKPTYYVSFFQSQAKQVINVGQAAIGTDYYNQSLGATLYRFNLSSISSTMSIFWLMSIVVLSYRLRSVAFGVWAAVVVSPIVWQHYFVVVIPLLIFILTQKKLSRLEWLLSLSAFFLTQKDWPIFHTVLLSPLASLAASHFFFGWLLLGIVLLIVESKNQSTHRGFVIDSSAETTKVLG